jgi:hypothetical protein
LIEDCEVGDINWIKKTERFREKTLKENAKKEEEIRLAIDNYQDLLKVGNKDVPK